MRRRKKKSFTNILLLIFLIALIVVAYFLYGGYKEKAKQDKNGPKFIRIICNYSDVLCRCGFSLTKVWIFSIILFIEKFLHDKRRYKNGREKRCYDIYRGNILRADLAGVGVSR